MRELWEVDLTEEETEKLLDKAAHEIRKRRMEGPAILALEMHKPLAGIASHMMVATMPFTIPFFGYDNVHDMSRLLKDRQNVERLIQRLECHVKDRTDGNGLMGGQYLDTGWIGIVVTLLVVAFILFNIARANKGKELFIRRIGGLNAIDEAVGRATELGRPVFMVPGLSDNINAKSMQAINIFAYVSRVASRFSNPIMVCCYNASILAVAQEVIRDVYQQEGAVEKFDPDSVRFISDRQFAFAASTSGLILREQAAAVFLLGEFYAESLILAETANSIGAIQVASSTELTQTPFFIAACDYVLIGDEFYAASAYLTRQPVLVGSLVGQDWGKLLMMTLVAVGVLLNTAQLTPNADVTSTYMEEKLEKPRPITRDEATFAHLFTPFTDNLVKDFKANVKREQDPDVPKKEGAK